jgi:hypothetical protein
MVEDKKDIVIGLGEIGKSIYSLFDGELEIYDLRFGDIPEYLPKKTRIMHICFPFNKDFIEQVNTYKKRFGPEYVLIHSTVPVGTSRKCRSIHSPVVGIHPHLLESLKTFTKFFGGKGSSEVADIFKRCGCSVYVTDKPETTELMKILCTTNYALNIEYTKDVKQLCDKYKVPFEFFTIWNNNYNNGYDKLGYPQYHRYNLTPLMKKQGGHCTLNNLQLLKSKFTEFLKSIC